jgi:hypothetical protein
MSPTIIKSGMEGRVACDNNATILGSEILKNQLTLKDFPKYSQLLSRKGQAESVSASALVLELCPRDHWMKESALTPPPWKSSHPYFGTNPPMIAIEVKLNTDKVGYHTSKSRRSENNQG